MCETHNYNQIIPYTDRLNYCSAPMNNNAWCRTIETMLGITVPPRAQVMRVILDEFSRCIDHFVCVSTNAVDLGALTNFWLGFQAREQVYKLFERLCGARLTVSLARVGGMGFDLPDGWVALAHETLQAIAKSHYELNRLLTKNRIFKQRMVGAAAINAEDAINWGFTGPCLRATGVPVDLRSIEPYSMYEQFEFDIQSVNEVILMTALLCAWQRSSSRCGLSSKHWRTSLQERSVSMTRRLQCRKNKTPMTISRA